MTVTTLSDAQIEAWREAAKPAIDTYIESAGEAGQKLVDSVRALY